MDKIARDEVLDYQAKDATQLASDIKLGRISPHRALLIAEFLLNTVGNELNCISELYPLSREKVYGRQVDNKQFAGVPFLTKDIGILCKDRSRTLGTKLTCGGIRSEYDSFLMSCFRDAGVVNLGRTTVPEFGFNVSTESVRFGKTHNPWKRGLSTGGSSGGSAAAVAACIVPVAHANDGGGSIRIPAACTGLFGLKPTRGRASYGPDGGDAMFGFAVQHVLTRSVRDSASFLDLLGRRMPGDPHSPPKLVTSYSQHLKQPKRKMQVLFTVKSWGGAQVSETSAQAVYDAAAILDSQGHYLIERDFDFDYHAYFAAVKTIWAVNISKHVETVATLSKLAIDANTVESSTLAAYITGRQISAWSLLDALGQINRTSRDVARIFGQADILLTPMLARDIPTLGEMSGNVDGQEFNAWMHQMLSLAPFCDLFNATGQPAASIPMYRNSGTHPVAVQAVGRFGADCDVLTIGAEIEEVQPWIASLVSLADRLTPNL